MWRRAGRGQAPLGGRQSKMRLISRRDGALAAALFCATIVVFQQSISAVVALAHQVETNYELQLLPGLVILVVTLGFNQYGKYEETKRLAAAAETEALQLRERARELERLSRCGQMLGRALSYDALRSAAWRHLPQMLGDAETWLAVTRDGHWEILMDTRQEAEAWWNERVEDLPKMVAEHASGALPPFSGLDSWCYPLVAQGSVVGVLGILREPVEPPAQSGRLIEALAPLLAIAVRNVQLFADVKDESTRDPMTGCVRRAPALEMLATELRRSRRSQKPLSIVLLDLDDLKQANDEHGHKYGDQVLAAVGKVLNRQLRTGDIKCRYGGDEFLLILPETSAEGAQQVAELLRVRLAAATPAVSDRVGPPVTASFGIAVSDGDDQCSDLVERADAALYQAKRDGRNCVRRAAGKHADDRPAPTRANEATAA